MEFENRVAKIGKGFNINLYVNNLNEISIFYYNNYCKEKSLNINNERFELKEKDTNFSCEEIIKLDDDLIIYKQNGNIGVIK